jgi:hypothetical protein
MVPKCKPRDTVMKNGILLTNMISIDTTTCWYHSRMDGGTPSMCPATGKIDCFALEGSKVGSKNVLGHLNVRTPNQAVREELGRYIF